MNVSGNALMDSKRDANSKVAKLALGRTYTHRTRDPKRASIENSLILGFLGLAELERPDT